MKATSIIVLLISGIVMVNCDEDQSIVIEGDYFPLRENSGWEYLNEFFSTADGSAYFVPDTSRNFIKGDTIFDGMSYRKVVDQHGNVLKVIRKKDRKYYGRNHELYFGFTKEYLFLDEDALANSSWRHYKNDSTSLTEYKVLSVNSIHTFNDVEYNNVMEVEVNYYYREGTAFLLHYSTNHYYAKGVGEIYAYYPYPALMYCDVKVSLLKYNP